MKEQWTSGLTGNSEGGKQSPDEQEGEGGQNECGKRQWEVKIEGEEEEGGSAGS